MLTACKLRPPAWPPAAAAHAPLQPRPATSGAAPARQGACCGPARATCARAACCARCPTGAALPEGGAAAWAPRSPSSAPCARLRMLPVPWRPAAVAPGAASLPTGAAPPPPSCSRTRAPGDPAAAARPPPAVSSRARSSAAQRTPRRACIVASSGCPGGQPAWPALVTTAWSPRRRRALDDRDCGGACRGRACRGTLSNCSPGRWPHGCLRRASLHRVSAHWALLLFAMRSCCAGTRRWLPCNCLRSRFTAVVGPLATSVTRELPRKGALHALLAKCTRGRCQGRCQGTPVAAARPQRAGSPLASSSPKLAGHRPGTLRSPCGRLSSCAC